jgi:hypothetical protein
MLCITMHFYYYSECRYAECRCAQCRGAGYIYDLRATAVPQLFLEAWVYK